MKPFNLRKPSSLIDAGLMILALLFFVTSAKAGMKNEYEKAVVVISENGTHLTFYGGEEDYDDDDYYDWANQSSMAPKTVKYASEEDVVIPLEKYNGLGKEAAAKVEKVTFDDSFWYEEPFSTKGWFQNMTNLKVIEGIDNLDTSAVTDMGSMFYNCSSLESLDLSGFRTFHVKTMESMFYNCSSLESLDLKVFRTDNVVTMKQMFRGCTNLSYLNVPFHTSNVSNMDEMFCECSKLDSLDLSSFSMANIGINTDCMIYKCKGLKLLKVSSGMGKLSDNACKDVGTESNPCVFDAPSSFLYGFDPRNGNFKWKSGWFYITPEKIETLNHLEPAPYMLLSIANGTMMFYDDNEHFLREGDYHSIDGFTVDESGHVGVDDADDYYNDNYYDYNPGTDWQLEKSLASKVKKVVFDPSFRNVRPLSTAMWFANMENLTDIEGLSILNTEYVKEMQNMFFNCEKLASIDLSHFKTGRVLTMGGMFRECKNLASIDLSSFDTESVQIMKSMFEGCEKLEEIHLNHFSAYSLWDMDKMFKGCKNIKSLNLSNFHRYGDAYVDFDYDFDDDNEFDDDYDFDDDDGVLIYGDGLFYTESVFMGCSSLARLSLSSSLQNIGRDACEGIGTNTPCILEIPENFLLGVDADNDSFIWKSGNFRLSDEIRSKDKAEISYIVYDDGELRFYYDNKKRTRKGTFCEMENYNGIVNGYIINQLYNVVIDPSFSKAKPKTTKNWFMGLYNLMDIDGLEWLDTSEVTDMTDMFKGCDELTYIDASKFDVTNAGTNTSGMFNGCANLEILKVSKTMENISEDACVEVGTPQSPCLIVAPENFNFGVDTSDDCFTWKNGHFIINIEGLEKMAYVVLSDDHKRLSFYNDQLKKIRKGSVYELDELASISHFHIKTAIFDPSFKETRPKDVSRWFSGSDNLSSIVGLEYLNTSEVTNMKSMFSSCSSLTTLDLGNFNTSNVTDMSYMFSSCRSLTTFDLGNFDTSKVTDMSHMFDFCLNLASLNLGNFDTSKVTDMQFMFAHCHNLTYFDLSNFILTDSMDDAEEWYEGKWGTLGLLYDCRKLSSLALSKSMSNLIRTDDWSYDIGGWVDEPSSCLGVGTPSNPCRLFVPDGFDFGEGVDPTAEVFEWKGGYFRMTDKESYVVLSDDGKTMTFYFDNQMPFRQGNAINLVDYEGFDINIDTEKAKAEKVQKVVFDESFQAARPTSTYCWFYGMKKLASIEGMKYLNTSDVTNMRAMFSSCNSLKSVDVSGFNTSKVTSMRNMFRGCSSLESLDVSSFNTSKVDTMFGMFNACSKLKLLDVSNFDTRNVIDMTYMFYKCTSLTSLVLGDNFDTSNVTSMYSMFSDCTNLASLDVSGFNTSKVTTMEYMFNYCHALEAINVRGFNTSKVNDMRFMFNECNRLKELDLSNFDMSKTTKTAYMFDNDTCLMRLSISATMDNLNESACNGVGKKENPCLIHAPVGFNFGDGIDTSNTFQWKCGWFHIEKNQYDAPENLVVDNVTETSAIVSWVDASTNSWKVAWTDNLNHWDQNESIVQTTTLTLDGLQPDKKYHVMVCGLYDDGESDYAYTAFFTACSYLILSEDTTTITFYYDSKKGERQGKPIKLDDYQGLKDNLAKEVNKVTFDPSFSDAKPTSTYRWFYHMENLSTIDGLEYLNTSEVTSMQAMFSGCKSLENIDLGHFNTSKVTSMRNMFYNCSILSSIDLRHFDTSKVTRMKSMFYGCSALKVLDVSSFDTSNLEQSENDIIFQGCKALTSLLISSTMGNIGEKACDGVGTPEKPCGLNVSYSDLTGAVPAGAYFKWKSGYFTYPDDIHTPALNNQDEQPAYNLQGIPVKSPKHGVYIKNGKKVVVK